MKIRLILSGLALIALVGCSSGGPDASAIQASLQKQARDDLRHAEQRVKNLGGDVNLMRALGQLAPDELSIENVEVLESKELDNGDYRVNFSFDTVVKDQRKTATLSAVVKDTEDGWRVIPPGNF